MKKIKVKRLMYLLFTVVCSILLTDSFAAYAAHTDGSTEVIARVETAAADATQSVTTGTVVPSDGTNISTGEMVSVFTVIILIMLIISVLAVYFLIKSSKHDKDMKF